MSLSSVAASSCEYRAPLSHPIRVCVGLRIKNLGKSSADYRMAIFDGSCKCGLGRWQFSFDGFRWAALTKIAHFVFSSTVLARVYNAAILCHLHITSLNKYSRDKSNRSLRDNRFVWSVTRCIMHFCTCLCGCEWASETNGPRGTGDTFNPHLINNQQLAWSVILGVGVDRNFPRQCVKQNTHN